MSTAPSIGPSEGSGRSGIASSSGEDASSSSVESASGVSAAPSIIGSSSSSLVAGKEGTSDRLEDSVGVWTNVARVSSWRILTTCS